MTIRNEKSYGSAGFTALIFPISLLSSSSSSLVVNSYAQQNEKTQNLTETNIPKVLPLVRGFADGNEVFYITTEVSDKNLANYLSNLTNSRVVYTPALKYALAQSLANIYEFTNGIKGNGPMGYQASIASTNAGDEAYSPLWRIQTVTWENPMQAQFLTSLKEITEHANKGI